MALTTKVADDAVTLWKEGAVTRQATVDSVDGSDYYVVDGCYFKQSDGTGVGVTEAGTTIHDTVAGEMDRINDLNLIRQSIFKRTIKWGDMTDAELETIADIVALYD